MKKSNRDKKLEILNEEIGPTIKYGKHSSYYRKGKHKIIIYTKKGDEELPEDVPISAGSRVIIFEDSKGNMKLSYELYSNIWKPLNKFDTDW